MLIHTAEATSGLAYLQVVFNSGKDPDHRALDARTLAVIVIGSWSSGRAVLGLRDRPLASLGVSTKLASTSAVDDDDD